MTEDQTAVTINRERLYGLKLRAMQNKPRVSKTAYLDHLLEQAGIPKVTEQEFNRKSQSKVKKEEVTA
jgi:hypothetical protein